MLPRSSRRLLLLIGVVALGGLLLTSACNDNKKKETAVAPTATVAGGGETPQAIDISGVPELEDGVLQIGSDIAYAPIEYYEEGTQNAAGLDVDLAKAIGDVLGVDVEFINTGFDGIILALQTDEFDAIFSAMTINPEREDQIDFVPYVNVGHGILVPAGNPNSIVGLADLCGLTVAVQLGTVQETMLNEANGTCEQQMTVVTFDTNPLAVEDLRTGGADANFSDFPVAFLDAQQSDGALEVVQPGVQPAPYGIGVRKESTELRAVLEQALAAIRADGTYDAILATWNLESIALP